MKPEAVLPTITFPVCWTVSRGRQRRAVTTLHSLIAARTGRIGCPTWNTVGTEALTEWCSPGIDFADPEVIELVQSSIPVVTIDYLFNNRIAIMSDNVTGMKELLEYIYSRGHRKMPISTAQCQPGTSGRLSSFYRTAERLGLQIPDEYIREAAYRDTATTYRMTNELLDLPDPPTCIIYPDDFASFGGINAIRERGLRIPEDISVAGYDGIQFARQLEPKLTTVQQDTEQIGCLAARELISLIERPKTTIIEQVIVPGKVVEGKSVAQIPTDK